MRENFGRESLQRQNLGTPKIKQKPRDGNGSLGTIGDALKTQCNNIAEKALLVILGKYKIQRRDARKITRQASEAAISTMAKGRIDTMQLRDFIRGRVKQAVFKEYYFNDDDDDEKETEEPDEEYGTDEPEKPLWHQGARKGPSHAMQLRRNEELIDAVIIAEKEKPVRDRVHILVSDMFRSGFLPEMFYDEEMSVGNDVLTARQITDLADNFVLWTLQNDSRFTVFHRMVVFFYLFQGLDDKAAEAAMKSIEKKNEQTYGLDAARIQALYREVQTFFQKDGETMLQRFLREAKLNSPHTADLVENSASFDASREEFWKGRRMEEITTSSIYSREKRNIPIPRSELEKVDEHMNIMMLQRGNITARNKSIVSILRLIASIVYQKFPKLMIAGSDYLSFDDLPDLENRIAEKCLEKLAMYDPQLSSISTYMTKWIKSITARFFQELETVRAPSYVNEIAGIIKRNPGKSDRALAAQYHLSSSTVAAIRSEHMRRGYVHYDGMREGKDGEEQDPHETWVPLSAPSHLDEVIERQRQGFAEQLLQSLPPRERYVLRGRFFEAGDAHDDGRSLEDLGDESFLTRERIRQLEAKVLRKLRRPIDHRSDFGEMDTTYVLTDPKRFAAWCHDAISKDSAGRKIGKKRIDPEDKIRWLMMHLGFDPAIPIGRYSPSQIVDHERKYSSVRVDRKLVQKVINSLRKRLLQDLEDMENGDHFVEVIHGSYRYAVARKVLAALRES